MYVRDFVCNTVVIVIHVILPVDCCFLSITASNSLLLLESCITVCLEILRLDIYPLLNLFFFFSCCLKVYYRITYVHVPASVWTFLMR